MTRKWVADCFDLDHSTMGLLVFSTVLTLIYIIVQCKLIRSNSKQMTGKAMMILYYAMMSFQVATLIPITIEAILFYNLKKYPPKGVTYIICETIYYLLTNLQGLTLYTFLFKIK